MQTPIRFHLDESMPNAVAEGLRRRGIDVTTSSEAQLVAAKDEEQLAFAICAYRAGQFERAVKLLSYFAAADELSGDLQDRYQTACGQPLLALTRHGLDEPFQARRMYDAALRNARPLQSTDISWRRRAVLDVLEREASVLLSGEPSCYRGQARNRLRRVKGAARRS